MMQYAQCDKQGHSQQARKYICLQPNCVNELCLDYKLSCVHCLFDIGGELRPHFIELPHLFAFCNDQYMKCEPIFSKLLPRIQQLKDKISSLTNQLHKLLSKLVIPESTFITWNQLVEYDQGKHEHINLYEQVSKFKASTNYRIVEEQTRCLKLIDDHLFDKLKDQINIFNQKQNPKLVQSITEFKPIPINNFIFSSEVRNGSSGFQVKCKQAQNSVNLLNQCFNSLQMKPGHMLVLEFQVQAVEGSKSIIGLLDLNKQINTKTNILFYEEVHQFEIRPEIVQGNKANKVDYLDHSQLNIINYVIIRHNSQTTIQIFVNQEYLSTIQIEGSLLFQPFTKIQHPKDNIWFKSEYLNKPTVYYT